MEFINSLITFGSALVACSGAAIGITGLSDYSKGKSQHNVGAQEEGLQKIVGGVAIILIGLELVPQITSFFS